MEETTPHTSVANSGKESALRRHWKRGRFPLFVVFMVALIAATLIKAPYDVERAIAPVDAGSLIADVPDGEAASAHINMPILDAHQARWIEVAWWKIRDPDALVAHRDAPSGDEGGVECNEHGNQADGQLFKDSQQLATYLAMKNAGDTPELRGDGLIVWAEGSYGADGPLRCADVITEINGLPVATWVDAEKATHDLVPGQRPIVRLADGTEVQLAAIRDDVDELGPELRVARVLGVAAVETLRPTVADAPLTWTVPGHVGGTSGGLALYLAALHALAPDGRDAQAIATLLDSGDVWATGELSGSGAVYGVGGVPAKLRGALERGMDAIVLSYANEDVARDLAGDAHVVPLDSVDELPQAVAENL